ncbi:hypothetical protein NH288_04780 [Anaerococcus sp. NML200537]|uniref:hypothetical protein n=1 Tax=Anaerococcus sp. NML200537 TaxID=2954485 RepID=UPI00223840A9|nr:hypothetical protein [Anaerococcus sp. NML200537]MCW6701398.1 hypothetical protein [Anaerococcus sp. NML200537]
MIINENLTTQDKIFLDAKDVDFRFASVFIENLGLVDGETYTFSTDLSLSKGESASIILFDSDYKTLSGISTFSTKGRNSFTFTYKEGVTSRLSCYAGIHGSTNGISAEYNNIKLEKGDQMTPYLPHKSKVKAENQAIFPIGGGYHEVYPL